MGAEHSPSTDNHRGLCVTCNQEDGTLYRIRVHRQDGTYTDMELRLCDRCFDSHRNREWIEPVATV